MKGWVLESGSYIIPWNDATAFDRLSFMPATTIADFGSSSIRIPDCLLGFQRIPFHSIDTETTSISAADAMICEIASLGFIEEDDLRRYDWRCWNSSEDLQAFPFNLDSKVKLLPGFKMPESASFVNGITDEILEREGVDLLYILDRLIPIFDAACYGPLWLTGFNIRKYDVPLLRRILAEHGHVYPEPKMLDVFDLFCYHFRNSRKRKLEVACERFGINVPGHRAGKDAQASMLVMKAIRKYLGIAEDMQGDLQLLREAHRCATILDFEYNQWSYYLYQLDKAEPVRLGFGKHAGKPLGDIRELGSWTFKFYMREVFPFAPEAVRLEIVAHGLATAKEMRVKKDEPF